MVSGIFTYFTLAATIVLVAYANDPNPLQDFCVIAKDLNNKGYVNGFMCKNPTEVISDDFLYRGLHIARDTNNTMGSHVKLVVASNLPGLNTARLYMVRLDYAASGGTVPPHSHPRASEVLIVLEGTLYTGFVTGDNKFFTKVLSPGDVFVYPQSLVHFAYNVGPTNAVVYEFFNTQNSNEVRTVNVIFGTNPPISVDVLSNSFQIDPKIVKDLQSKFPIKLEIN